MREGKTLGTRIMGCLGSLLMMALFVAMLVATGWFVFGELTDPSHSAADSRDHASQKEKGGGRRR